MLNVTFDITGYTPPASAVCSWAIDPNTGEGFWWDGDSWEPIVGAAGGGTVTSVAMTGDNVIFASAVGGSPVTTSGTLVPALKTQAANRVLAGPATGADATPTFRALVAADVPAPAAIAVANEATDTTCFPAFFTAATGDLSPKTNAAYTFDSSIAKLTAAYMTTTNGFTGPTLQLTETTAATNMTIQTLVDDLKSSGTVAAGFGVTHEVALQSSTTASQGAAVCATTWATATHASRKARQVYSVYDTAARECLRLEASGSAPMIGFLGAAASAALSSPDLGTLATTFGLATGTPTFARANLTGVTPPKVTVYSTGGSSGTHNYTGTPIAVLQIAQGAGGGGAGSGTTPGAATAGGNTTVGSVTGNGGALGRTDNLGAAGGTASGGDENIPGGDGTSGGVSPWVGGRGGGSRYGDGAPGAVPGNAGVAATIPGAGGSGGGGGATGNSGGGGGGGGNASLLKTSSIGSSAAYSIGAKGNKGTAGTGGTDGGDGAPGYGVFVEYYQ